MRSWELQQHLVLFCSLNLHHAFLRCSNICGVRKAPDLSCLRVRVVLKQKHMGGKRIKLSNHLDFQPSLVSFCDSSPRDIRREILWRRRETGFLRWIKIIVQWQSSDPSDAKVASLSKLTVYYRERVSFLPGPDLELYYVLVDALKSGTIYTYQRIPRTSA